VDTTVLVWDLTGLRRAPRPAPRPLPALWEALGGEDAAAAYEALWGLVSAPGAAEFLAGRLAPAALDRKRVDRLVKELDDDDFKVREKATEELKRMGEAAEPLLRKALEGGPSAEVRWRVQHLLGLLGPAGPGRLRALRGLEALERIGGPEARRALRALAKGAPEARLTGAAAAALRRLSRR
jgi:hypothetical protein